MIITKEHQESMVEKYKIAGRNFDECIGFVDGMNAMLEHIAKKMQPSVARYLITTKTARPPFLTHWFDADNNFNAGVDMIVYDLIKNEFTTDGKTWHKIEVDNL